MNRIKELRKARKMSQAVLADILGVTRSTVSMWEIDKSEPDADMFVRIADLFGVSTDDVLGRVVSADVQKEKPVPKDELSDDERELLRLFRQLNAEAQARLLDTADDMVRSGKYVLKNNAAVMAAEEVSK